MTTDMSSWPRRQGSGSQLQAYDAQSGQQKWYENASYYGLTEQFGVPTASQGLVFVAADAPQSSIGLIAADETSGAGQWEEPISSDDFRGPAVDVDGVYLTHPCGTGDFRPATGESVWSAGAASSSSCLWSGAPPVVANQLVYSPPGDANDPGGFIFDAESGTNTGAYAYGSGVAAGDCFDDDILSERWNAECCLGVWTRPSCGPSQATDRSWERPS